MSPDSFALSPHQQALWFAHMSSPDGAEYQTAELLSFDAPVDFDALAHAIRACVGSLEVFQARYDSAHEATRVAADIAVSVLEEPVASAPEFAREVIGCDLAPNLSGPTLTKHWLFQDAAGGYHWLARFHHITCDGFFVNALLTWIAGTFSAPQDPPASPFAPLADTPSPEPAPEVTEFWARQPIEAPPSIMHGAPEDNRMVCSVATLGAKQRQGLREIARNEQVTELDLLFTAAAHYCAVLSGVSGPLCLGLPLMNRPLGARTIEQGPRVTVLPLIVEVSPQGVQPEQVARAFADTRAHQHIFSQQIRALHQITDPHQRMLGPHLNFRPFSPSFSFGTARAHLLTISVGPINDCEFILQSAPHGGLDIMVLARGSNFAEQVELHARRLGRLLAELSRGRRLAGQSVALPAELDALSAANATAHPLPASTLAELIRAQRERCPAERRMLGIFSGDRLTWRTHGEVWEDIDKRVETLRAAGVGPGHVVALHLDRGEEFCLSVAALALVGAAWCPIDPSLPAARKQHMFRASRACAVLGTPPPGIDLPVIGTETRPLEPTVDERCAYILFTSGSTGLPKAVAVSQAGIVNRLAWMYDYYRISPHDVLLHKTPSSFDVSVWEYLLPFSHGVPTAVATPQAHRNPEEIARQLQLSQASLCHFVPAALDSFHSFITHPRNRASWPASSFALRALIASGEALPAALAHRVSAFFGAQVHNLYGPAEAAIDVTAHTVREGEDVVPIGKPVWNTQIYLVDQFGALVPPRCPGTLLIGGIQVALGYVGQPELSAQKFFADPFRSGGRVYDSGDIAQWVDGEIVYLGRADSQVKIRGQRLELAEIEAVLTTLDSVSHAAAVLSQQAGQPLLVAYYVSDDGRALPAADLDRHARRHLPEYMVPQAFIRLDSLPLTANGKFDHKALPAPPSADAASGSGSDSGSAPSLGALTPTQQRVVGAFTRVLGTTPPSLDASFFALGGNSLSAVELALELDGLAVADVFATNTPRGIAQLLSTASASTSFGEVVELAPPSGERAVFCFAPAGGLAWSYSALAYHLAAAGWEGGVFGLQSPGITDPTRRAGGIGQQARAHARTITKLARRHGITTISLVGWSVGGVVAQEVARHLDIAGLYLLDSYPPSVWRQLPPPADKDLWEGVLALAGVKVQPGMAEDPDRIIAAMRQGNPVFASLSGKELDGIRTIVKHNAHLMREHRARAYGGPAVHYLAAADAPHRSPLITPQAWHGLVGTLEEVSFDVAHPGMVGPEALADVAGRLAHAVEDDRLDQPGV